MARQRFLFSLCVTQTSKIVAAYKQAKPPNTLLTAPINIKAGKSYTIFEHERKANSNHNSWTHDGNVPFESRTFHALQDSPTSCHTSSEHSIILILYLFGSFPTHALTYKNSKVKRASKPELNKPSPTFAHLISHHTHYSRY